MKKTILFLIAIIFTLAFIVIVASFLNFIFFKIAASFDINLREIDSSIDIWMLQFNLFGIGISYVLYLIIFKVIVKKRISLIAKGILSALMTCLFFLWVVNTFALALSNMFELNVIVPLSVFLISGFSLPFVDEFFMKKFGLKD